MHPPASTIHGKFGFNLDHFKLLARMLQKEQYKKIERTRVVGFMDLESFLTTWEFLGRAKLIVEH